MWRLIDELKRSAFGPTRGRSEESRRDGPPVLPIRLWPGCAPVGTGVPSTRLRSLPVSLSSFSFNPSLSLPRVHHRDRKREREGENEGENDRSTRSWEATTGHYGPIGVTWTLLQATILPSWTRACDAKDPDRCVRETNEIRNIEREEEIRYPL